MSEIRSLTGHSGWPELLTNARREFARACEYVSSALDGTWQLPSRLVESESVEESIAVVAGMNGSRHDDDTFYSQMAALSASLSAQDAEGKGLGNDGVVLTIDDAGPALTQMVNELLLACYGMRFTVEIRTQRALADSTGRRNTGLLNRF